MKSMKFGKKLTLGFTLVEVMVAMGLMAGVILGSMSYFYMGSTAQFDARVNEFVLNELEVTLEQRVSMPYDSSKPYESINLGQVSAYGETFNRSFMASETKNEVDGRYKDLTATVNWIDSDGKQQVMEMRSIMNPRGFD